MEKIDRLSAIETIGLITTVMVNQIIFNIPNIILQSSGSSAWLNIIFIGIIAILFVKIICQIFNKFPSQDIVDVAKFAGGNTFKTIVGIIYMLFFLIYNIFCISYFANALLLIYFPSTPVIVLIMLFIFPIMIMAKYGLKSISSVNLVFIPFVLLSVFILFFGSADNFVFERLFPILGLGIKETFLYGLTNLFSFLGLAYLFFINPYLKDSKDFKKISYISVIISFIYLFLAIFCLLLSFSFITSNEQLFSLYLLTRLLQFGNFLQRVDAIFILLWIFNTFCFCSFGCFYIMQIFKKLTNIKNSKILIYPLSAITFCGALVFNNIASIKYITQFFYKYISLPIIFILSPIILILANLKYKKQKKG